MPSDNHDLSESSDLRTPSTAAAAASPARASRWLAPLLLIEIVVTGALFVAFLFYQQANLDAVDFAQRLLDPTFIGVGIVLMLVAAVACAAAIWTRRRGAGRASFALVGLAVIAGIGFLAALGADYNAKWQHNLLAGNGYHPTRKYLSARLGQPVILAGESPFKSFIAVGSTASDSSATAAAAPKAADPVRGKQLFMETCAACHGAKAQGLPHQGATLTTSKFIAEQTDAQLLSFVKAGRQPGDPKSVLGLAMPPKGGNPSLDDAKIADIVSFLRTVQKQASQSPAPANASAGRAAPGAGAAQGAAEAPAELIPPKMLMSPPVAGPAGLRRLHPAPASPLLDAVQPPSNMQRFFLFYFLLTGAAATVVLTALVSACLAWRRTAPSSACA